MVPISPRRAATAGVGLALVVGLLTLPAAVASAAPGAPQLVGTDSGVLAGHADAVRAGGDDKFVARGTTVDALGDKHVRLDRSYKGLPVLGGDVVTHSSATGALKDVSGGVSAPLNLSTSAKVSAQRASNLAASAFAGRAGKATPELAVDALDGAPALAWSVVVDGTGVDNAGSRQIVLVDATSGAIRNSWDTVKTFAARTSAPAAAASVVRPVAASGNGKGYHAGNVTLGVDTISGGYQLVDPTRGNGETRDANNKGDSQGNTDPTVANSLAFTSTTGTFGDNTLTNRATVAVDAHYGIQETWDYYKNVLGRNGIKNDGVGSKSYVHYYVNYGNAGWSDTCFCMIYGDGAPGSTPFTELDVTGHEMSHGVAAATAGLVYSGDAGGINEANSDIFGTEVEFYANNANDVPDYLIGEKIDINGNGTPLRYMDDPKKDGVSVSCWTTSTKNLDPHYSSGVGNHLFFLLAAGSGAKTINGVSYNSPTCNGAAAVTGIGNDAAGKIWYKALSTYMTSGETYPSARKDTIKAANDLYGTGTGTECAAVKAAWLAAGVVAQTGEAACATGGGTGNTVTVTNPGNKTGTVGTAASLQISATDSSSTATLTYSATGLPTGLSISTTGLISGTPSAAGTFSVTVTAKDNTNVTGTASFTWTISGTGGGCTPSQAVVNGGFESGTTPWTATSGVVRAGTTAQPAHAGTQLALLGGKGSTNTTSVSQSVVVPAGCTTYSLSFYLHIDTKETTTSTQYDKLSVQVGTTTLATYSNLNKASGYALKTINLAAYAGQTITLKFSGSEDVSLATNFVLDDIAVNAS